LTDAYVTLGRDSPVRGDLVLPHCTLQLDASALLPAAPAAAADDPAATAALARMLQRRERTPLSVAAS
jgi:hypothetical protein